MKPIVTQPRVSSEGHLVIIGGSLHGQKSTRVDVYKIQDGSIAWQGQGHNCPLSWTRGGSTVTGSDVIIAGGFHSDGNNNPESQEPMSQTVAKYNVKLLSWEMLPNMTIQRPNVPTLFVMDEQLYVAGGASSTFMESLQLKTTQVADESEMANNSMAVNDTRNETREDHNPGFRNISYETITAGGTWQQESAILPYSVGNVEGIVVKDKVFLCGGRRQQLNSTSVLTWSQGLSDWKYVSPMGFARTYSSCIVTDGEDYIYVISGCNPDECWPRGFIERYSVSDDQWTPLDHVPNIEEDHYNMHYYIPELCAYWDGQIFVIFHVGGYGFDDRFHVYDVGKGVWNIAETRLRYKAHQAMSAVVSA